MSVQRIPGTPLVAPAPNGGVGDQSAAVQAWLNSLSGGPTGIWPQGVYGVATQITIPSNVCLIANRPRLVWTGAANGNVAQIGSAASACVNTVIVGVIVADGNSNGTGAAWQLHSLQNCDIGALEGRNLPGGYNFQVLADSSAGGLADYGNNNFAGNHIRRLYGFGSFIAMQIHGASSIELITHNVIDEILLTGIQANGFGIFADQWADTNVFPKIELLGVGNGITFLTLNSSGAGDQGVYDNKFGLVSCDAATLTGCTAVSLGQMSGLPFLNTIERFFTSPSPFAAAGTLLSAASGARYDITFVTESPPYRQSSGYHAEKQLGPAPALAIGSGGGSTGTVALGAGSSDRRGTISWTPGGTGIVAGTQVTLTFASAYGDVPRVFIAPSTNATAGLLLSVTPKAAGSFSINAGNAGLAGTTYTLDYEVLD